MVVAPAPWLCMCQNIELNTFKRLILLHMSYNNHFFFNEDKGGNDRMNAKQGGKKSFPSGATIFAFYGT